VIPYFSIDHLREKSNKRFCHSAQITMFWHSRGGSYPATAAAGTARRASRGRPENSRTYAYNKCLADFTPFLFSLDLIL